MNTEKWRIDNDYEQVYIYDAQAQAYLFYCHFRGCGITRMMSERRQIEILEEGENV